MRFLSRLAGLVGLVGALGLGSLASLAQEVGVAPPPQSKSPQPPMFAWNGSYSDKIPIDVPSFRGLTPNISLTYDSSRGIRNIPSSGGILGVGWSMGGLSTIERISGSFAPVAGQDIKTGGRGVPAYGAAGMPESRIKAWPSGLSFLIASYWHHFSFCAVNFPAATVNRLSIR